MIEDPDIRKAFDKFATPVRARLLTLRSRILEVASETPGVGRLQEALKWGQPAYVTAESGSGTTIRLGCDRKEPGIAKLYVPCQTSLIEQFRGQYGELLCFSGNRAVVPGAMKPDEQDALRHCIALALTYHATRKRRTR